ncbi:hypothetical protein [Nocardia sp. IFM 10818]
MAPLPNGVYGIGRPVNQLCTLLGSEPGAPALLLPPTGNPGEQDWELEVLANGNVTLRNVKAQLYLGVDGDLIPGLAVTGTLKACEWALYQSAVSFAFHIVVPGGPIGGVELALDLNLLQITPPRIGLRALDVNDQWQAWRFFLRE